MKVTSSETFTSSDCCHPDHLQHVVSDVVICVGIINSVDGAEKYECARQIIACQKCGRVAEVREVDRPPT